MIKEINETDNSVTTNGSRSIKLLSCQGLDGLDFAKSNINLKICQRYCDESLKCKPPVPLVTFFDDLVNTPNTTIVNINEKIRNFNLNVDLSFENVKGDFHLLYEIELLEIKVDTIGMQSQIKMLECIKNHESNKNLTWHINMLNFMDEAKLKELEGLNNIWLYTSDGPTLGGFYKALQQKGFEGNFQADANKYSEYKWMYVYSD